MCLWEAIIHTGENFPGQLLWGHPLLYKEIKAAEAQVTWRVTHLVLRLEHGLDYLFVIWYLLVMMRRTLEEHSGLAKENEPASDLKKKMMKKPAHDCAGGKQRCYAM